MSQQLEAQLAEARRREQAAQEELRLFVYAASHDVKESLRAVSAYTQLMLRQPAGSPEAAEFAGLITDGIKTAINFLDRMNAYSRIDMNPRMSQVSLAAVVQGVIMSKQPEIRDANAKVTYHDLPSINGNEPQLTFLITALLDNALRYRAQQPPAIDMYGEETDEGVVLSVKDNGSGIPPDQAQSIFTPFKRLHAKGVSGIALSLASCAKIAAAHQGSISVESDGTTGSAFKVFFPY